MHGQYFFIHIFILFILNIALVTKPQETEIFGYFSLGFFYLVTRKSQVNLLADSLCDFSIMINRPIVKANGVLSH